MFFPPQCADSFLPEASMHQGLSSHSLNLPAFLWTWIIETARDPQSRKLRLRIDTNFMCGSAMLLVSRVMRRFVVVVRGLRSMALCQ